MPLTRKSGCKGSGFLSFAQIFPRFFMKIFEEV